MKFSIGLRLFFAVLLSIFGVAAMGLALMAGKVSESFSDYAIQIELNRLQEISESLQTRYAEQKNWSFIPTESQEKITWISTELLRLYQKKSDASVSADTEGISLHYKNATVAPQPNPPPQIKTIRHVDMTADAMLPPLPAIPPVPPKPPAPPVPPAAPAIAKLPVQLASSASEETLRVLCVSSSRPAHADES